MFALTVRSLDGGCRRISVGPSLAELKLQLEQSLPQYHHIQLFQGEHELTDDRSVEVEVQAVVTKSADEPLMAIEEFLPDRTCESIEALSPALQVLDEIGELTPAHSKKMFEILHMSAMKRRRIISKKWLPVCAVFGRVCADPSTYLTPTEFVKARSLIEKVCQYPLKQVLKGAPHRDAFSSGAKYALQVLGSLGAKMDFSSDIVDVLGKLLKYGMADEETTTNVVVPRQGDPIVLELFENVASVLQLLTSQKGNASMAAVPDADSEQEQAQAPVRKVDQGGQSVDMENLAAGTDVESDPVFIHQQDLQEAIMRSKADGPAPLCYDGSMVVYRLTRSCEETLQALSTSPALGDARKRVKDAGCSLFPGNARGACSLVPLTDEQLLELGLQLEKYHLLALRSDKPAIVEALRMVPPARRPKLRDDHRTGPIEEQRPLAEDLPGIAPAAGSDVLEEVELLNANTRARIREMLAANVTESAPCEDASCERTYKISNVNPRHWK